MPTVCVVGKVASLASWGRRGRGVGMVGKGWVEVAWAGMEAWGVLVVEG